MAADGDLAIVAGMNETIRIVENDGLEPVCPYCEREIRSISLKQVESMLGVRFLYFCSECRKVLGISHRKGFWMG